MSTAISLQYITPSTKNDAATVRHRSIPESQDRSSISSKDDEWLDTPHDAGSSNLPLDSRSFSPTNVYWVTPHGIFTGGITILDLTKDLKTAFTGWTDDYRKEVRETLKDHSFTPTMTCRRRNWLGLTWDITDDQDNAVAHWSHCWTSCGEATLTFPETSTYSDHPIQLRNKRWGRRAEAFVYNSIPFIWEPDSRWHSKDLTLYRIVGSGDTMKKVEVAKCSQKFYGAFVTGGILVVDERELDGFLACLTLLVVLKKKRQRACERRNCEG